MTCGCEQAITRHNLFEDTGNPLAVIGDIGKTVTGVFADVNKVTGGQNPLDFLSQIGRGFAGLVNEVTGVAAEERAEDAAFAAQIAQERAAAIAAKQQRDTVIVLGLVAIAGTYLLLKKG